MHICYAKIGLHVKRWVVALGARWARLLVAFQHPQRGLLQPSSLLAMQSSAILRLLNAATACHAHYRHGHGHDDGDGGDGGDDDHDDDRACFAELSVAAECATEAAAAVALQAMFRSFDAPYYAGQHARYKARGQATSNNDDTLGSDDSSSSSSAAASSGEVLHGLACSVGRGLPVEGLCRVCRSLADAKTVQPGEVLVVESTGESSWTVISGADGGGG